MGEGIAAAAARCDVTKRAEVERLVAWTVEQYGALDIMVANAGALPTPRLHPAVYRRMRQAPCAFSLRTLWNAIMKPTLWKL